MYREDRQIDKLNVITIMKAQYYVHVVGIIIVVKLMIIFLPVVVFNGPWL